MPTIKTPLKDLLNLFAASASDEKLDKPTRVLAAKQCVLVAHMIRIESVVMTLLKAGEKLEKDHKEASNDLASALLAIQKHLGIAPAPAGDAPTDQPPASEEDEATAMAEKVLADTEAEVAKLRQQAPNGEKAPVASVTPLKPVAAPAGDAS